VVDPALLALAGQDAKVDIAGLYPVSLVLEVVLDEGSVVGVYDPQEEVGVVSEFCGRIAGHTLARRRDVGVAAVRRDPILPIVGKVGDEAEPLLAVAKGDEQLLGSEGLLMFGALCRPAVLVWLI
jgi:hypothetical protein